MSLVSRVKYSAVAATLMVIPVDVCVAQVQINSQAIEITLTGRLHTQFSTTSVAGERASEFKIRRTRLTARMKINDFIDGAIQPDFGQGKISLKDAYLRLTFDSAVRLTFGQFKRAFDIFELPSSTQILVIERTGSIAGVDDCDGPGGVCSWSSLTEKLEFADRDVGVAVDGRAGDDVEYRVTLTNGTGANASDENGTKSYSGRATWKATSTVRLGANVALHDYVNPTRGRDEYAVAYGADLEIGTYGDEVHLKAGVVSGQNWQSLDAGGEPGTLLTAQAILSYRFRLESGRLSAVEPLGRVSWGDPDTAVPGAGGLLLTPGIAFHLTGRNMLVANLDVWSPSTGSTEWSIKMQSFLHF